MIGLIFVLLFNLKNETISLVKNIIKINHFFIIV